MDFLYHLGKRERDLANPREGRSLTLANMPFTISEGRSEEKNGAAEQKPELFETWTLFRSLQSHPFTRPGRGTVSSLGARQAWPELILAELFVVFICQDLTN